MKERGLLEDATGQSMSARANREDANRPTGRRTRQEVGWSTPSPPPKWRCFSPPPYSRSPDPKCDARGNGVRGDFRINEFKIKTPEKKEVTEVSAEIDWIVFSDFRRYIGT